MRTAIKVFEFEGESQHDCSYKITVYHKGKVVETFQCPTMQGAYLLLSHAGYYEKDRT
jgi:hypothetical protein